MKFILILVSIFCAGTLKSQDPKFIVRNISLPDSIRDANNQFSGLYIFQNKLYIMSESRIQEKAEAKIYSIDLSAIDQKLADSSYKLKFKKIKISGLDILKNKMMVAGDEYEGLEAFLIDRGDVYFSVETATPSHNCYLIKGKLNNNVVVMDANFLKPVPKFVTSDDAHVYNAGFEAMMKRSNTIYLFFEYNFFPHGNSVKKFDITFRLNTVNAFLARIEKIPFRVTDITSLDSNHFTAINYFFKGEGRDTIYRPAKNDTLNNRLVKTNQGYRNYCRLISMELKVNKFTWKPLWEFPEEYMSYNWEGIAEYKKGYFIINDKYSPVRPYQTTLLYFQKKK